MMKVVIKSDEQVVKDICRKAEREAKRIIAKTEYFILKTFEPPIKGLNKTKQNKTHKTK